MIPWRTKITIKNKQKDVYIKSTLFKRMQFYVKLKLKK